ncbi:hypothetical protein FACS1894137_04540 [Spirochaetia bacterium]|nr:hypothetical protein FACS1894137_04540 [Spirochaetia bacterium]
MARRLGGGKSWKPTTRGERLALAKKWKLHLSTHASFLNMPTEEQAAYVAQVDRTDAAVAEDKLHPSDATALMVRIKGDTGEFGPLYSAVAP